MCIGLNIRGLFRAQLHVRDQEVSDDLLNSLQSSKESEREAAQGNDSNFNPLIPEGNKHLISPYNITPESNIKVMRIKEMTIN